MDIISAIGGLAGSLFGSNKAAKTQEKINQQNIDLQKQFAQSGVQWKVADAKAAGIHPLAALGAQTHSFAPISVGSNNTDFGAVGQNIGRALDATMSPQDRQTDASRAITNLQIERGTLENELLRTQLASQTALVTQAGRSPGVPAGPTASPNPALSGNPNLPQVPGIVTDNPMPRIAPSSNSPYAEPGHVVDMGYSRTPSGGYAPLYSKDTKERLEDDEWGELNWGVRNRLLPFFSGRYFRPPPNTLAGRGNEFYFNPFTGEYRTRRRNYDRSSTQYQQRRMFR